MVNVLNVVNSYVGRDFMTSVERRDLHAFWFQAALYIGVFAISTLVAVFYRFLEERLGLLWRKWLTQRAIEHYLLGAHLLPPAPGKRRPQPGSAHLRGHPRPDRHHPVVRPAVPQRRLHRGGLLRGPVEHQPAALRGRRGLRRPRVCGHRPHRAAPGPAELRPARPRGQLPLPAGACAGERRVHRPAAPGGAPQGRAHAPPGPVDRELLPDHRRQP